jgi:hypothetical protein
MCDRCLKVCSGKATAGEGGRAQECSAGLLYPGGGIFGAQPLMDQKLRTLSTNWMGKAMKEKMEKKSDLKA